jgi:hypothetical protein
LVNKLLNSQISKDVKTLNPAVLLQVDSGPPEHDCLEIMDEVFSSRPDLTDQPISYPDVKYFTDGSSFVWEGTCFDRYTVVTWTLLLKHDHCQSGPLHKTLSSLLSHEHSSSLQECE